MKLYRKNALSRFISRTVFADKPVPAPSSSPPTLFEPLEQRILLSADLSYGGGDDALDLVLRLDQDNPSVLQLIDNTDAGNIVGRLELTGADTVEISGSSQSDTLTVDLADPAALGIAISFIDITAGDGDTLRGPSGNSTWNITGPDSGSVESVSFSGIENLTGAADNEDVFVVNGTGSISGLIDGGTGGYDSMMLNGGSFNAVVYSASGPHSGTIARDGSVLTYDGLEPITDDTNTTNRVIYLSALSDTATLSESDDGRLTVADTDPFGIFTFESITFAKPSNSLTINLGSSNDNVIADPAEPITHV